MIRAFLALGVLCALSFALAEPPGVTPPKPAPVHRHKRLAVVNFEVPKETLACWFNNGNVPADVTARVSQVMTDMFITALMKTGSFDVIERTELQKVLDEHKLGTAGILDAKTAPHVGKVLGVDMILGGKITEFGVKERKTGVIGALTGAMIGVGFDIKNSTARVVIDARVIDTTTARILMADSGLGENKENSLALAGTDFDKFFASLSLTNKEWVDSRIGRATRAAVDDFVSKMLTQFPPEAMVKGVLPDGGIILDLGRFAGIKLGDEFDLMQETIMLDDEGEELYRDHKPLGVIKVVDVQDERCKCTPVAPLPQAAKKGDYATLKRAPVVVEKKDAKKGGKK